jgi:hypothetical protein
MHHDIDTIETFFEEYLIGLKLERIRHDSCRVRKHAVLGNDGVTFNARHKCHGGRFQARVPRLSDAARGQLTTGHFA